MICYYPDLDNTSVWLKKIFLVARSTKSTTQIWVETSHQYGISTLISQRTFCGETSCCGIVKCWLYSQTIYTLASAIPEYIYC